jgi:hypothetical protein
VQGEGPEGDIEIGLVEILVVDMEVSLQDSIEVYSTWRYARRRSRR